MWLSYLRRAVTESCGPRRNWRWMLSSLGVGAGFGLIAGLERLGQEPARITLDVASSTTHGAITFLVVAWLAAVTIRFGRFLRAARK
jgi:hypothetical protein